MVKVSEGELLTTYRMLSKTLLDIPLEPVSLSFYQSEIAAINTGLSRISAKFSAEEKDTVIAALEELFGEKVLLTDDALRVSASTVKDNCGENWDAFSDWTVQA